MGGEEREGQEVLIVTGGFSLTGALSSVEVIGIKLCSVQILCGAGGGGGVQSAYVASKLCEFMNISDLVLFIHLILDYLVLVLVILGKVAKKIRKKSGL